MKTLIFMLVAVAGGLAQRRPPSYSLDDMPETSFDCRDKILGGYYADPETDCQMFHVCVKVPGVGVQNYKFLCPNDTAFDQESQICASWYDVDCEAALLYSNNFDLYRIGYVPSSVLPGPSSPAPVAVSQSRRQPIRPQVDDDYYLQTSDTGDRRLQPKDVLRGSSSGNFFNQKKGREEEEATVLPKKKVAVRKFRKRPQQEEPEFDNRPSPSTSAPTVSYNTNAIATASRSTSGNSYLPRYNTIQRSSQTTTADGRTTYQQRNSPTSASTSAPVTRDYQTQSRNTYNAPSNTVAPPSNNYNYQNQQQNNYNSAAPAAPASNNYNYQDQTRNNYNAPSPTASTSLNNYNYQTQQRNNYNAVSTTIAPAPSNTYYNNNNQNAQRNNEYTVSTTLPPSGSSSYQQRNGNSQRYNTFSAATTFNPNTYSSTASPFTNDAYTNTFAQRGKSGRDFSTTKADFTTGVTPSTYVAETYQTNYNNFNQRGNANSFSTTTAKSTPAYYDDYQYKSTGSSEEYSNYNPNNYEYQKTNYNTGSGSDTFVNGRVEGESLKTAPSNNYNPSSFNSYQAPYNEQSANGNNKNVGLSENNRGSASYTKEPSTYYTTKQETYDSANISTQQTTRNSYYTSGAINNPSTNQQVSSLTTRQQQLQTDKESAVTYDQQSNNRNGYYISTQSPKAVYNTNKQASTSVTYNGRSNSYSQSTTADAATTIRPQYTQAVAQKQYSSPSTTRVRSKTTAVSSTTVAVPKDDTLSPNKKPSKKTDVAYDYAYYDEAAASEYDGLDPISDHHFGKGGESLKVARTVKT